MVWGQAVGTKEVQADLCVQMLACKSRVWNKLMPGILQFRACKQIIYSLLASVECYAVPAKEDVKCRFEIILLVEGRTPVSDAILGVAA